MEKSGTPDAAYLVMNVRLAGWAHCRDDSRWGRNQWHGRNAVTPP